MLFKLFSLLFSITISILLVMNSMTVIEHGNIGIHYKMGTLQENYLVPGLHLYVPFVEKIQQIPITNRHSHISNISCYSKEGIEILFDRIDVVNKLNKDYIIDSIHQYGNRFEEILFKDPISQHIHQFCTNRTIQQICISDFSLLEKELIELMQNKTINTVQIQNIILYKPSLPQDILDTYEKIEVERLRQNLLLQKQQADNIQIAIEEEQLKLKVKKELEETEKWKQRLTPEFLQYETLKTIRKQKNIVFMLSEQLSNNFASNFFNSESIQTLPYTLYDPIEIDDHTTK